MRQQAVVGVYKSEQDAQNVLDALSSAGFPRDRIIINHEADKGRYNVDSSGRLVRSDNYAPTVKNESAIQEFFRALVGKSDEKNRAQAYAHAVNQGNIVLQVTVDSEDQADRASDIMDRYDPIDIDEYALSLNNPPEGMTDVPSYMQHGAALSDNASRTGNRMTGTSMGAGTSAGAGMGSYDDSPYRRHWQSAYGASGGSYDEYEPAYRYGSYLAGSDRWRGRQWNEVEPDVRNEWEASHPKGTWERFKDSIRYGWESMTGQARPDMQRGRQIGQRRTQTYPRSDQFSNQTGAKVGDMERPVTASAETIYEGESGGQGRGMEGFRDDSPYRRHWQSTYGASGGSYDEYEPAYRYGSYLAGSDRWRGRQLNEVEPDVRNEWEASHPKGTWERFKDSIRYGWESMTGSRNEPARRTDTYGMRDTRATGMERPAMASRDTFYEGGAHTRDTEDFRSHCQEHWKRSYWTSGGSYDDYEPAYRYGADFADNDTNPNHRWEDVENRLQSEWVIYNRDQNSWEKNKDAIRCGWERGRLHGRSTHSGHSLL